MHKEYHLLLDCVLCTTDFHFVSVHNILPLFIDRTLNIATNSLFWTIFNSYIFPLYKQKRNIDYYYIAKGYFV